MAYTSDMKILTGNASRRLTDGICAYLETEPSKANVGTFSDGEIRVQIGENIRGRDVFLVNSTSPPVNRHLMELLVLIDAAKRASAERITAVLPYFGYARQDRKDRPRVPITAKLVANLLTTAGADRVLTVDLHCGQLQGFFDIPVDHLSADVVFEDHVKNMELENMVVVAPDAGSAYRAGEFANRIGAGLAIVDKRRPQANVAEVKNVIGTVDGKHAIIYDDLMDTAGSLTKGAAVIKQMGALSVRACITHPVLSGPALENVESSSLEEILVSDSIPLSDRAVASGRFTQLSLAPLIAEAIRRIHKDESVSSLFR